MATQRTRYACDDCRKEWESEALADACAEQDVYHREWAALESELRDVLYEVIPSASLHELRAIIAFLIRGQAPVSHDQRNGELDGKGG